MNMVDAVVLFLMFIMLTGMLAYMQNDDDEGDE